MQAANVRVLSSVYVVTQSTDCFLMGSRETVRHIVSQRTRDKMRETV